MKIFKFKISMGTVKAKVLLLLIVLVFLCILAINFAVNLKITDALLQKSFDQLNVVQMIKKSRIEELFSEKMNDASAMFEAEQMELSPQEYIQKIFKDKINQIMQQREGLGNTGYTYLMGASSNSSDKNTYLKNDIIFKKKRIGEKINSEIIKKCIFERKNGREIVKGITGQKELVCYYPLEIEGLQWGIFAAMSLEEVKTPTRKLFLVIIFISVVVFILVVIVGIMFSNKLVAPINRIADVFKDIAEGEGDLTKRVKIKSSDEINLLADWFNVFVNNLNNLVLKVKKNSVELTSSSEEVSISSEDLVTRANEQAASITKTSTTLEEFTGSVKNNTALSEEANEMLETFNKNIQDKKELMENVTHSMTEIFDSSKQIDNIVNVINDISFQTNLLALNAAVEAARAGEAGRGFAVVAAEVRNLAQKTAESSTSIRKIVTGNVEATQKGMELVKKTSEFFNEITTIMGEVVRKINEITGGSKEQAVGIEHINQAIVQLDEVSSQNAALAEELSASGKNMKVNANELQNLVEQFKVK